MMALSCLKRTPSRKTGWGHLSQRHAHTHTGTQAHVFAHTYRGHTCAQARMHAHIRAHTHSCNGMHVDTAHVYTGMYMRAHEWTHTHTHTHTSGVTGHTREIGLQGGEGLARGEAGSRRASWQRDSLPASRGGPGVPVGWGGTRPPIPTSQAWEAGAVAGLLQL